MFSDFIVSIASTISIATSTWKESHVFFFACKGQHGSSDRRRKLRLFHDGAGNPGGRWTAESTEVDLPEAHFSWKVTGQFSEREFSKNGPYISGWNITLKRSNISRIWGKSSSKVEGDLWSFPGGYSIHTPRFVSKLLSIFWKDFQKKSLSIRRDEAEKPVRNSYRIPSLQHKMPHRFWSATLPCKEFKDGIWWCLEIMESKFAAFSNWTMHV